MDPVNVASGFDFAFWMPDGRPSSRDPMELTISEWRKPDPGMPPLSAEQHIVSIILLRPTTLADEPIRPYAQFKRRGGRYVGEEYGLVKTEPSSRAIPNGSLSERSQSNSTKDTTSDSNLESRDATQAFYATENDDDLQVFLTCSTVSHAANGLRACSGDVYSRPDELTFHMRFLSSYLKDWRSICEATLALVRPWQLRP